MNRFTLSRDSAEGEPADSEWSRVEGPPPPSGASERVPSPPAHGWTIDESCGGLIAEIGEVAVARVTAVSPEQICFQLVSGSLPSGESAVEMRLRTASGETSVPVDRIEPLMNGVLTARVVAPGRGLARQLLGLVDELIATGRASVPPRRPLLQEIIEDPARRCEVVESMIRNGCEGTLRAAGFPIGEARPLRVSAEGVVFRLQGPPGEGPFTVELVGYNSLYSIDIDVLHETEDGFVGAPARMLHLRHRTFRRVAPPEGTYVEFSHPRWPDQVITRPVREISAQGLSFCSALLEDLTYPGLQLDDVTLHMGGHALRFSGEVKTLARQAGGQHHYCGFHLYPSSAVDETRWLEVLDDCLHATTRIGSRWARPTWELYNRAGYFALSGKDPSGFQRLLESFENVSARIDAAPRIGCQAVWPHDHREVEGAMSMLKLYSSAWLVFQLAKVSGPTRRNEPSRKVLRDLHVRCYEHAQRDPDLRWLVGIPQVKQTWSRAVHYDLPRRYVAADKADIVRFRAVEVPSQAPAGPWPDGLEIAEATAEEIVLLAEQIAATRSAIYADALDLTPEQFGLAKITAAWAASGFRRRRAVLVARRAGEPVAAVLLESADDGMHLFRLLDSARLYPLARGGERELGALLSAAGGWYAAQRKKSFVAFLEDEMVIPAGSPTGVVDLGLADYAILSAAHLPELLEHVYEVTAPRLAPISLVSPNASRLDGFASCEQSA